MKPIFLASVCVVSLIGLAACAPGTPPTARTALDCPQTEGDLTRSSVAADQKSCVYTTHDGDQVALRLIPVAGGYQATLGSVEQELQSEVMTDKEAADAEVKAAGEEAKAAQTEAKASAETAAGAAKAAKEAAQDALSDAREARKEAKEAGEDTGATTHVDLPGIHISADEDGKADVNVGMIHVNANDDGATVRMSREVRLRGEALSREKRGFRATYILARDHLKDGWVAVGYQAGGPKAGPITVAVIKSRTGDRHGVLDDVKRLVRRNSGA